MCEEYCLSESVNFQQHKQKSDFSIILEGECLIY